jgi:pimeloyl-ACP methyl ester carboxylesterase
LGYVYVNGSRLYYEEEGQGETIVFVHGFGLDCRMWDQQFSCFSKQYRVLRYDLRGFGRSDTPKELYSHTNDLVKILDFLNINKAHLVGLSMGGGVAVNFALQAPERVLSLTLASTGLDGYVPTRRDEDTAGRFKEVEKYAEIEDFEKARQKWLELPHFQYVLDHKEAASTIKCMTEEYSFWHFRNKNPMYRPTIPARNRLRELKSKTLILYGENDLPDSQYIASILKNELDFSQMQAVVGAGHMINMEEAETFNDILSDFLKQQNAD